MRQPAVVATIGKTCRRGKRKHKFYIRLKGENMPPVRIRDYEHVPKRARKKLRKNKQVELYFDSVGLTAVRAGKHFFDCN